VTNVDRKSTLVTDESALYTRVGKFSGQEKMNHTGRTKIRNRKQFARRFLA